MKKKQKTIGENLRIESVGLLIIIVFLDTYRLL